MATIISIPDNPYIIGRPIYEPECFFGRDDLFAFIQDNLKQRAKVILLHGQRRIGKSSILFQIPLKVQLEQFFFVSLSLEGKSQKSLNEVLCDFTEDITEHLTNELKLSQNTIKIPSKQKFLEDLDVFTDNFLPQIYEVLGNKNLVLLLDEFDVLGDHNENTAIEHFFPYLHSILFKQEKLFIIPVIGRRLDDLPNLLNLFNEAPHTEIGLLKEASAKRLIVEPTREILEYEPDAIEAILKLSVGHPYFTQVTCFALFGEAREQQKWTIKRDDVEKITKQVIEFSEAGLVWFHDGLLIPEKVVFSAVAELQEIYFQDALQAKSFYFDPLLFLENKYGVIQTNALREAKTQLLKWGYLKETQYGAFKITVELVRRWLVKRYQPRREIWELEKIDPEANYLYENVIQLYEECGVISLKHYRNILNRNPNHFSALFNLAEGYLETGNYLTAVQIYERAYRVDPVRSQEGFVRSLIGYGNGLMFHKEFLLAEEQFKRVLEIQQNNLDAQQKIKEIKAYEARKTEFYKTPLINRLAWIGVGISILSIFTFSHWSLGCPFGQQKIEGICVVPGWYSFGERRLFRYKSSGDGDDGAKEFDKGNYQKAKFFFERATEGDRTDPELRIYLNNTKARLAGNSYKIAVAVPVDSSLSIAKEMLQGVAQAQEEFTRNKGSKGRLLEILIVNDGNDPERAKKIAQTLASNPAILAVIGHNNSDVSAAALPLYEKAGLAMVSPSSSSTTLSSPIFFRTAPSNEKLAEKLVEDARGQGINRVAVFYNPKNLYSHNLEDEFKLHFEQLGGRLITSIDMTRTTLDPDEEVKKLQGKVEAFVLLPDTQYYSVAIAIARANHTLPPKQRMKLLGGNVLYQSDTLNSGGDAVTNLTLVMPLLSQSESPFTKKAENLWTRQVSANGQVSWRTMSSYDATEALIHALSANPTRKSILDKLKSTNLPSSETSGERLKFSQGERLGEPVLVKVSQEWTFQPIP